MCEAKYPLAPVTSTVRMGVVRAGEEDIANENNEELWVVMRN